VNLGRLGFLAEIDVAELPRRVVGDRQPHFTIEPRMAVRTYYRRQEIDRVQ
jgi:NAD+ kinase